MNENTNLETFLTRFNQAFLDEEPEPLLNWSVREIFLKLLHFDKVRAFMEILEPCQHASYLHDIVQKFQNELVHRFLIGIPRDLNSLMNLLEQNVPNDPFTKALEQLTQEVEPNTDWIEQEAKFLFQLQKLRDTGSRFENVIAKILHVFLPGGPSKASTNIVFVRRGPTQGLFEYLRPAIVRKIDTVGDPALERIFPEQGIDENFEETARVVQMELKGLGLISNFIKYGFADVFIDWEQFKAEGRSGGLAFAFLLLAYNNSLYRHLTPYLACFGCYEEGIITRVEQIRKKVAAAKENGIRILVLPESNVPELKDEIQGCHIIKYPENHSLGEVLNYIISNTEGIAKRLQELNTNLKPKATDGIHALRRTFLQAQEITAEERRRIEAGIERERNQQAEEDEHTQQTMKSVVGELPSETAKFFKDRIPEQRSLRELLACEKIRLVLISGRAGIGKTALITKLLHDHLQESDKLLVDRIVYITLRDNAFRSTDKIIELISQTLETDAVRKLQRKWQEEQTSPADKLEFLFHQIIGTQRYLIVLDNLETVLDEENHIHEEFYDLRQFMEKFLECNHSAQIVATSRRTIVFPSEVEERVGSRWDKLLLDTGLPEEDAIELLCELDIDGELGIRYAPHEILRGVVRRCHGIPHTLKALAAKLRERGRSWTLSRLVDDEVTLNRLAEDPAQELYESLSPEERLIMQALAVYNRSVPATAVGFMLPAPPVDSLLDGLVRNYAVNRDQDHFGLHSLDQQYAYHQIPDSGGDYTKAALHRRAAEYYKRLRKPEREWRTVKDIEPQLQEYEHLYHAGEYEMACKLLNTCMDYLYIWKYRLNQWGYLTMTDMYNRLLKHTTNPQVAADILLGAAISHHYGNIHECFVFCKQAIAKAIESGHEHTKARALRLMTWIYHKDNVHLNDLSYLEEALRIFQRHGDLKEEITTHCDLARACLEKGQLERGKSVAEQGLSKIKSTPHEIAESRLYHTLGRIHAAKREWEEALNNYHAALKLFEKDAHLGGKVAVERRIGVVLMEREEYEKALYYYKSTLSLSHELGIPDGTALTLYEMGRCYYKMGADYRKDALINLLAAKHIHDKIGMTHPDAPIDKFLNEIKATIGLEEYERLVRDIDLSQIEYLKPS